jgi:hypothetical protein
MTKYELPNGTTVMIPTELLLKLSDIELQDYLANASSFHVNDPFYDSVLDDGEQILLVDAFELPEGVEDIPEGFVTEEEE